MLYGVLMQMAAEEKTMCVAGKAGMGVERRGAIGAETAVSFVT